MYGFCYDWAMRIFTSETIARRLLSLTMIAFCAFGLLGLTHVAMATGPNGEMLNCPFMGSGALCQMNPFQHIAEWQRLFTALPLNEAATILIIASLTFFIVNGLNYSGRADMFLLFATNRQFHRVRFLPFTKPLQEAFSSGILHSKVF